MALVRDNQITPLLGVEANRTSFTPLQGELLWVTDTKEMYVGDGVTPGGVSPGPFLVKNPKRIDSNEIIIQDPGAVGIFIIPASGQTLPVFVIRAAPPPSTVSAVVLSSSGYCAFRGVGGEITFGLHVADAGAALFIGLDKAISKAGIKIAGNVGALNTSILTYGRHGEPGVRFSLDMDHNDVVVMMGDGAGTTDTAIRLFGGAGGIGHVHFPASYKRVGGGTGNIGWDAYGLYRITSASMYKEGVVSVHDAISVVKKLKPVNFRTTHEMDDGRLFAGFIADEVVESIPEANTPDGENYDDRAVQSYLTKALQEVITRVETLEVV